MLAISNAAMVFIKKNIGSVYTALQTFCKAV
jgi:hypothetical protein